VNMLLMRLILVMLLAGLVFPAAAQDETHPASAFDSGVAQDWYALQLRLVTRTWGFSPPVAARAFGYTGVTLYESIMAGMPEYQSLAHQLSELGDLPQPEADMAYHWPAAANSALATITRQLFPTAYPANKAAIDALEQQYAEAFRQEVGEEIVNRSSEYGQAVANTIFEWSQTDGGHEGFKRNFPTDYLPPTGDGLWVRTPRAKGNPQPAMQPTWGSNRPFVPGEGCDVPAHPDYSTDPESDFYAEAMMVYNTVNNLSTEQLEIARYWADDPFRTATPAGHSISILMQVLNNEGATLDVAAEAYAKVGIALADSFISCWKAKYEYNLLRPVTYIQNVIDPTWMPVLITPPFPEYPSGHSVESGAVAQVLTDLFGENYTFTDHTHDEWGLPSRSFGSFNEFAEEAAMSRVYGGIHFPSAVQNGLEQGRCVAARVASLNFR
jgi:hypothetical protein